MRKLSPEVKEGFRRFRHQRRAYYSFIVLTVLFLLSLPAELLCNSKPLLIYCNGRFYFPVFKTYTAQDFGGDRQVEPDYQSRYFLRLIGKYEEAGEPHSQSQAAPSPGETQPDDILNLFDSEPGGDHASEPSSKPNENALHSTPREEPVVPPGESILDAFDPEPRDVPLEPPAGRNESVASAGSETARNRQAHRCFILWPPVRYDYAYISTGSRSGRDALVAPWHQTLPGTEEEVRSSWVDGHYLGTDDRGRDVLARLVYGFRVSLLFGFALALSGTVAGAILGAIQGFFGGWVDLLGQRFTEIWGSLPRLYLLMILSSLVARNIYVLFIILNLTSWMGMAAYMRAEFLKGRNLDYVRAARALGVPNTPIMFRHILPNSMTPIITFSPFAVTGGILALVSLDFLALGVPSPFPSLGELLAQGQANLRATWIILPTFVVLSGTITLLTFIGDGLRNAFDPRKTVRK